MTGGGCGSRFFTGAAGDGAVIPGEVERQPDIVKVQLKKKPTCVGFLYVENRA